MKAHALHCGGIALLVLLLLTSLPTALQAQFTCTTNTDGTLTITRYTGPDGAVDIPSTINGRTVTGIAGYTFVTRGNVISITIPNSIISIEGGAFYGCTGLTNITIPNSVTSIGGDAFYACTGLRAITVDALNPTYSSVDGVLFNHTQTVLLLYPPAKSGSYTVPNTVRTIGQHAFYSCKSLTNLTLPNSLATISSYAFLLCSLTNVTIPGSVTNIGASAFYSCSGLSAITVDALNPAYSSIDGVLFDKSHTTLLQYPAARTGTYTVPEHVTYIQHAAFQFCSLTSATIPNSVTNLSDYAFADCPSLANITIPGSVNCIGAQAFSYCPRLTSVTLSNGVRIIEDYAFQNCGSLSSVSLPDSVTTIGAYAFATCRSLSLITLPNGLATIENNAFDDCLGLASITIPDSVTSIGAEAFSACWSLTTATIGSRVTSIREKAFEDCSGLKAVYFKGNAPALGASVFNRATQAIVYYLPGTTGWGATFGGCPTAPWPSSPVPASFTFITNNGTLTLIKYTGASGALIIPSTTNGLPITAIADHAFCNCTNLTSIILPNSITTIGIHAFENCAGLANVTLGTGLTSIQDGAFLSCSNLTALYFRGNAPALGASVFGSATQSTVYYLPGTTGWGSTFGGRPTAPWPGTDAPDFTVSANTDGTLTITGYTGPDRTVTIPGTIHGLAVTRLGDYVFVSRSGITNLSIPDSVISIGGNAFWGCGALSAINVDPRNSVYSSVDGVLCSRDQTRLLLYPPGRPGSYTVPNSVKTISQHAFYGCRNLTQLTFPNSGLSISDYAFVNCTGLTNLTIPSTITNIGTGAFYGSISLRDIIVDPLNPAYSSIDGVLFDKSHATLLQYPAARAGTYTVPDHVTYIQHAAFQFCSLTSATIPNSVTNLSDYAFADCPSLANITIPGSVNCIGAQAFSYCPRLTSVTLSNGVTIIEDYAFQNCRKLTNISLPNSVTSIHAQAFLACSNLTTATIGSGVTAIQDKAFENCSSLTAVYFKGNAPALGASVFNYVTEATVYYLPGTTGWGPTFGGRPAALWPCAGLQVSLNPPEAIAAGARWQLDGGPWLSSGTLLTNVIPGNHTLGFSALPGWLTPAVQTVTLTAFQTTSASAAYQAKLPYSATATPVLVNGFVVGATLVNGGYGYTNPPAIYFVGGGGSGAQAIATISNGLVTSILMLDAGFGYTNPPTLVIAPPIVVPLRLQLSSATALSFTNLLPGSQYQLQTQTASQWTDLGTPFTASATTHSSYADGHPDTAAYRLVALPLPLPAIAIPQLVNGFVVGATLTSGGSGYSSPPAVRILGGGGSGAQAVATINRGSVIAITMLNAGFGYTNSPTFAIDPPPVPALTPTPAPALRLDAQGLIPHLPYQFQTSSNLTHWTDAALSFTATAETHSHYLPLQIPNIFFRLRQEP